MNIHKMVWKIANEVSHRMGKINSRTASIRHDIQWIKDNIKSDRVLKTGVIASDQAYELFDLVEERLNEIEELSDQYKEVE